MKEFETNNCLEFSIKYKLKHKNSKIKVENNFLNIIKIHGVTLSLFRYMRYIGFFDSLKLMLLPHFYIEDDGRRIEIKK